MNNIMEFFTERYKESDLSYLMKDRLQQSWLLIFMAPLMIILHSAKKKEQNRKSPIKEA